DASQFGIDWNGSAGLYLHQCDFERNGSSGNAGTGCINYALHNPLSEYSGLHMLNCWMERNTGGYLVKINPGGHSISTIQATVGRFNTEYGNPTQKGLWVVGGSNTNWVKVTASSFKDNDVDYYCDGPNAIIQTEMVAPGISTAVNGGVIRSVDSLFA
ncbi:MAG TPA: hypothetical protein VD794_10240, partial [Flavisolibacter sp.]|nr:hypothetical protein [Flavisolibacter sp.]